MKKIGILLLSLAMMSVMSCNGGKKSAPETVAEVRKIDKKVIVARLVVKQGQENAFTEVASKLVAATRQEEGNLFYALYQSPLNPVEFIFYEEYKDDAAFRTHAASAHFAGFVEGIKDLRDGDLIVDEF